MRLHRNCSNPTDYDEQSNTIINRFVEKGYNRKELVALKEKVKKMHRNVMIEGKSDYNKRKKNKNINMAFLMGSAGSIRPWRQL